MGLAINLFVHGVPMGQKTWGPKGEDKDYISKFYGPKWSAPEFMKVDIMNYGGQTYCYYTFFKGQNVCASDGRTGSYFALTLRMNAFYCDVQNLYGILKAAYEKMCVGLCVRENNNVTKYLVSDFQNVDSKLKDVESHILKYIGEFSINEDIVNLSGFPANTQNSMSGINLHECTKPVALNYGKKYGTLMVSPYFLSATAAKTVAAYKTEIETTKQKADKELQMQQKASQEKIDNLTKQAKDELELCKEKARREAEDARIENERKLYDLKHSYESVDQKISEFKQKISELKRTIADKESDISSLKKQLKSRESELNKLKNKGVKSQNSYNVESSNAKGNNEVQISQQKKSFHVSLKKVLMAGIAVIMLSAAVFGYFVFCGKKNHFRRNQKSTTEQQVKESTSQTTLQPH